MAILLFSIYRVLLLLLTDLLFSFLRICSFGYVFLSHLGLVYLAGEALGLTATTFFSHDAIPQWPAEEGDPDLSVEPGWEGDDDEEEGEAAEALTVQLESLLPTPTTANEVAVELAHLHLHDSNLDQ